ncbi:nucleotidyltransferase family protein [Saprospiraceae bacterium]|nr:nucleotidyltransferase family protein [Saprospiraceae bacterium]
MSNKYNLTEIGLFGSYAQGMQSDASDIDILVEFKPNTNNLFELKLSLKNELSEWFGKAVDICRLKYIKPYFKDQILESAIFVE